MATHIKAWGEAVSAEPQVRIVPKARSLKVSYKPPARSCLSLEHPESKRTLKRPDPAIRGLDHALKDVAICHSVRRSFIDFWLYQCYPRNVLLSVPLLKHRAIFDSIASL